MRTIHIVPEKFQCQYIDVADTDAVRTLLGDPEQVMCSVFVNNKADGINIMFNNPHASTEWSFYMNGLPEPVAGHALITGTNLTLEQASTKKSMHEFEISDTPLDTESIKSTISFVHVSAWHNLIAMIKQQPELLKASPGPFSGLIIP